MGRVPPPFLSMDDRMQYLEDKNYFSCGGISPENYRRLDALNFHYFLGYTRNYYKISQRTNLVDFPSIDDVFSVIDSDHEMSTYLYSGLRKAEMYLRASFVYNFCHHYNPVAYLDLDCYANMGGNRIPEALVNDMMHHVLRYREPYVRTRITTAAQNILGSNKPPETIGEWGGVERVRGILQDLPLWSVVDSFSLGLLSKAIEMCQVPNGSGKDPFYKDVAADMGINHNLFLTNIRSLTTLRNSVAHCNRLWMKPTTDTPKKPKKFERKLRNIDSKGMYISFANVALFQTSIGDTSFLERINEICDKNPLYAFGVKTPLIK